MYKKLGYGMLRWIVDFILSGETEEPLVMVGAILTKQVGECCVPPKKKILAVHNNNGKVKIYWKEDASSEIVSLIPRKIKEEK